MAVYSSKKISLLLLRATMGTLSLRDKIVPVLPVGSETQNSRLKTTEVDAGLFSWTGMRYLSLFVLLFIAGCLVAGCCSLLPTSQNTTTLSNSTSSADHISLCSDKACFIAAANDCNKTNITITEDFGVMRYETSTDCAFTKTLVNLDGSESQEMKNLLEGKNMTCVYAKGNFDPNLVNKLMTGMENCTGELKVNLARLLVFT